MPDNRPVGAETQRRIDILFAPGERAEAAALLETQCGRNLPLAGSASEAAIERIQIAALKLSGGDRDELVRAIELAQVDWRDLLVAAGFEHDVQAHLRWLPGETP